MRDVFAIGDLHGCPDELEVLLEHLKPGADDELVFLGDYVDRGTGSRQLVDRLLRLHDDGLRAVFLRGNHEDMLLDYLGLPGQNGDSYLLNGGQPTLESYGVSLTAKGRAAAALIPPEHVQFLLDLRWTHVDGDYLFVHAGIRPGVALSEQDEQDLIWIREEFFTRAHDLPYTVVFGHTPHRQARITLPYHIGLDTGLVYGNKLTCFDVRRRRLIEVGRGERRAAVRDLAPMFAAAQL